MKEHYQVWIWLKVVGHKHGYPILSTMTDSTMDARLARRTKFYLEKHNVADYVTIRKAPMYDNFEEFKADMLRRLGKEA